MKLKSSGSVLSGSLRLVAAAAAVLLLPFSQRAQAPPAGGDAANPGKATPVNRFEGDAQFKGKDGKSKGAHVTIRQWTIPGKQKVDALPERGFLVVTVRAGKVTSTIGGKQEQRTTGDFWTVAEGQKMSVEAAGETALLEVVSVAVR